MPETQTAGGNEPVAPEGLDRPGGRFLCLAVGGKLLACGGVRVLADAPGVAEIKRMYVMRAAHGLGYGPAPGI
jgi:hypothetical protein